MPALTTPRTDYSARIMSLQKRFAERFATVTEPGDPESTPVAMQISDEAVTAAHASTTPADRDEQSLPSGHNVPFKSAAMSLPSPPASIASNKSDKDAKASPSNTRAAAVTTASPLVSATTRDNVFGNPKLFDTIFLNLSIQHILVNGTRVCKSWKASIEGSPRLPQALFFQPIPLLVEPRGEHFYEKRSRGTYPIRVYENPLLERLRQIYEDWFAFQNMRYFTREDRREYRRVEARLGAARHPKASWRRMLAFQPPVINLDFQHNYLTNIYGVENETGLTLRNTGGDAYVMWRINCYPIQSLYQNMHVPKRARDVRRVRYRPGNGAKRYGWEAECVEEPEEDQSEESD